MRTSLDASLWDTPLLAFRLFLSSHHEFHVYFASAYDMTAMLRSSSIAAMFAIFTYMAGFGISMFSLAIVDSLSMIIPSLAAYKQLIGLVIIILAFASTIKDSRFLPSINSFMTVILLASIALFVLMGLPKVKPKLFGAGFFSHGAGEFLKAIATLSFVYQGTTMSPISMMAITKKHATLFLSQFFGLRSLLALYTA